MNWTILLPLLTSAAAIGAVITSVFSYRRGKRFENENHLYKIKMEVYPKILRELYKLISILDNNVDIAENSLKEPTDDNLDELDDNADEVDNICIAFNEFIVSNSLVIPEKILKLLTAFDDKVQDAETLDTALIEQEKKNRKVNLDKFKKLIDDLTADADKISDFLRKDLQIEKLNSSLYNRLK